MGIVTREMIVNTIREWSIEEQIAVVEDILEIVKSENRTPKGKRAKTLHRALGIAATNKPAPDDETVEQWRRERLEEKYGL
jgi:hypothetical protein